jgi:hypothetical protein
MGSSCRFLHEDTMGSVIATTHPHDCFGACLTGMVCSPKPGPDVMRVRDGLEARKDCHEPQPTHRSRSPHCWVFR